MSLRNMAIIILTNIAYFMPQLAGAALSMDIADIKIEMHSQKIADLESCALEGDKKCNIRLGIHNMYYDAKLKDDKGDINYGTAEKWLSPITGQSPSARYLLGNNTIRTT